MFNVEKLQRRYRSEEIRDLAEISETAEDPKKLEFYEIRNLKTFCVLIVNFLFFQRMKTILKTLENLLQKDFLKIGFYENWKIFKVDALIIRKF